MGLTVWLQSEMIRTTQSPFRIGVVCERLRRLSVGGVGCRGVSLWIKSKIGFDFSSLNFYWLNYLYIYCRTETDCSVYFAFGTGTRNGPNRIFTNDIIPFSYKCVVCITCIALYFIEPFRQLSYAKQ